MTDYDEIDNHPLKGVPQAVLDVARGVLEDVAAVKGVHDVDAHPIADAVVSALHEAGLLDSKAGVAMQITVRDDAKLKLWLPGTQTVEDVVRTLRMVADHFEAGDVTRVQ